MEKNLNEENKKLKPGIYKNKLLGNLFYFSGRYNKYGDLLLEDIKGEVGPFPVEALSYLKKLNNNEIKKKINWLEKGLDK